MAEAVSLYSGSLSSSVATELVVNHCSLDRVVVLTLRSPFFAEFDRVKGLAQELWPGTRFRSKSIKKETDRIGAFARNGSDGRKSYCSKCQAILLETGRNFLSQTGADFLVSGEAISREAEARIEDATELDEEAGLDGLVFRPLSSLVLPDSLPEEKGWVPESNELTSDKKKRVAEDLRERLRGGCYDFLSAKKRCKLTRQRYRKRLKDLMREDSFNVNDLSLLDFENYYKIPPNTKVVLGEGAEGKRKLHNYFLPRDLRFYLPTRDGPMALVRPRLGDKSEDDGFDGVVELAARITAGRGEVREDSKVEVNYRFEHENETYSIKVSPMDSERIQEFRL
ncbi:hypothetical protein KGY71_00585 [Candidatus Bipolaricaulota bacterium]|nr:hypothetical protein [Candidatus Bipolaricaulota bacterium]